ncbi:HigA family addiction module antitoxin [Endozoicomonas arenosclerae]|uniref:HigA family addiction module antitoxin n=1 Tax=Endozoicomonas arenosclerae TaxID=1633495 RepID=UPI000782AD9B|nr:HigA family addiction module antitoxin [Endozoicomonas arenosclerae]
MSRTRNRKPTHPGIVFRQDVLEPAGISVTKAAEVLGVSRKHLSEFVNQKKPCTRDLAIRIAIATKTSVASWLNMQTALDVWEADNDDSEDYLTVGRLA